MKKAQSISINTIIVAAIALIVLIVIILIFTGNLRGFRENTDSCIKNGGECIPEGTCNQEFDRPLTQFDASCNLDSQYGSGDSNYRVCCLRT
jgi:hypothetical protein